MLIAEILFIVAYLLQRVNRYLADFSGDWQEVDTLPLLPNVPDTVK